MDQGEHLNTATFAPVNIGDINSPIFYCELSVYRFS